MDNVFNAHRRVCCPRLFWGVVMILSSGCFEHHALDDHPCDACRPCEQCSIALGEAVCTTETGVFRRCMPDGHVHSFNRCNEDEGIHERCPERATCVDKDSGSATCDCINHFTGEECDRCPAHYDEDNGCATCLPHFDPETDCTTCIEGFDLETDCTTCIGNYDPETDCEACLGHFTGDDCDICPGNWDPDADCDTCRNHWVDDGDDCGTCPPRFDSSTDCRTCAGRYIGEQCDGCIGNWDPEDGCATCRNHWEDNDDDCGTCPTGFDSAADCNACLGHFTGDDCDICPGNWDPARGCAVCRNFWQDDGDDCGTCPPGFDPEADCNACLGNRDFSSYCTTCRNHWEDNDDDCGTCPAGFDPAADCNGCLGHRDLASDCTVCRNHWEDNDDDCGTCPPGVEPASDCTLCKPGWDPAVGCLACLAGYSEATDCQGCAPGFFGSECSGCVRYVKPTGDDASDGTSWEDALSTIHAGVAALGDAIESASLPSTCTLAIAEGDYWLPDANPGPGILLGAGMVLVGGFSIGDDPVDTPADATTVVHGAPSADGPAHLHVFVIDADIEARDVRLVNLTITGGRAESESGEGRNGGGVLIRGGNVELENCTITDNTAANLGGGVHLVSGSLAILGSRVAANSAYSGGGIYIDDGEFQWSGATSNDLLMLDTIISDNSAEEVGGGLQFYNYYGELRGGNLVWIGNQARNGGAMALTGSGEAFFLYHNTITRNHAEDLGAAIDLFGDLTAVNCIFYDNESTESLDADGIDEQGAMLHISYSLIDGLDGGSNFFGDPLFTSSTDVSLKPGSPCIDAGYALQEIPDDIDGNERYDDDGTPNRGEGSIKYTDVGAYEFIPGE
jgi:hypothetical protein